MLVRSPLAHAAPAQLSPHMPGPTPALLCGPQVGGTRHATEAAARSLSLERGRRSTVEGRLDSAGRESLEARRRVCDLQEERVEEEQWAEDRRAKIQALEGQRAQLEAAAQQREEQVGCTQRRDRKPAAATAPCLRVLHSALPAPALPLHPARRPRPRCSWRRRGSSARSCGPGCGSSRRR